jgi:hypothetical protein
MRNILLTIPLALFYLPFSLGASTYIVIKDNINLRVDSRISAYSLGFLSENDEVEVTETKFGWHKIKLPGKFSCYVAKKYLERLSGQEGRVLASKLNLRSQPDLEAQIIGVAKQGAVLSITGELEGWFKVVGYPYAYAWVHGKFLKEHDLETELASFVDSLIFKLSEPDIAKKKVFHGQLAAKGKQIIPLLEAHFSEANIPTSYSLISILTQVGKSSPEISLYFLEKVDPLKLKSASMYLDIAQGIIKQDRAKVAYFHLAQENNLTSREVAEARDKLKLEYTRTKRTE